MRNIPLKISGGVKEEIIITSRLQCVVNSFGLFVYRWGVNGNNGRLRRRI